MVQEIEKRILDELQEIKSNLLISSKPTLTIREAAMYIGKTEDATYKVVRSLTHYKQGKTIYIDRKVLDDWMHEEPVMSDADFDRLAKIYCDNKPMQY